MRFFCVNDNVPALTTRYLREACEARDVEYVEIDADGFDFDESRQLQTGDLLYRPAVSLKAWRVEQFLYAEGVASFHSDADGPFFSASTAPLLFQRHGLPIPMTFYCHSASRSLLNAFVTQLGGYPVVLKVMGSSRGIGVMRADSAPALYSLVDYALAQGAAPLLCAFVEGVHWRVTVVGDTAVAAYRNTQEDDDFRTYASENPDDFTAEVRPDLANLATRAVKVLRLEFGGVDILEHASGRLYLLESNFPAYFATAQELAGIDVAGAMVEHLIRKSQALTTVAAG